MYDRHALLDLLSRSSSGHTLPQPFYTDARLYDFDVSVIFARCWLMIGFEVELPQPGAYLSTTIGPNPVLVVRGRDGAIRGFHNTCRHRGSQICAEGRGRTPPWSVPTIAGRTTSMDGCSALRACRMTSSSKTTACNRSGSSGSPGASMWRSPTRSPTLRRFAPP